MDAGVVAGIWFLNNPFMYTFDSVRWHVIPRGSYANAYFWQLPNVQFNQFFAIQYLMTSLMKINDRYNKNNYVNI